jgi:hypothetical protein
MVQTRTFLTEVSKRESRKWDFAGAVQMDVCDIFVSAGKILSAVTKDLEKRTVPFPAEIARSILKNESKIEIY